MFQDVQDIPIQDYSVNSYDSKDKSKEETAGKHQNQNQRLPHGLSWRQRECNDPPQETQLEKKHTQGLTWSLWQYWKNLYYSSLGCKESSALEESRKRSEKSKSVSRETPKTDLKDVKIDKTINEKLWRGLNETAIETKSKGGQVEAGGVQAELAQE